MDKYRMLNDIHKPSSTRAEVSTSSSERDDEETDKSRFSEKEIGDPTGRGGGATHGRTPNLGCTQEPRK